MESVLLLRRKVPSPFQNLKKATAAAMSGTGSNAAKALKQLSKDSPTTDVSEENRGDGPISSDVVYDDDHYNNNNNNNGPESPTDRAIDLQSHQQKILARLARKESEAQARLDKKRKAMRQRRKVKTQSDMFDKLSFNHDQENLLYYEHIPIKPGIEAYKWLAPVREEMVAGKKHHRPGLDALKIDMPDTVIYSDRYAGVADMWLSTSSNDGCVVNRRLTGKWIEKYVQRAAHMMDVSPSPSSSSANVLFGSRRPLSVLKISHWQHSESRNITRVIPEYSLAQALKAPTPTPGSRVCIQNFVHSRGAHASCYRVAWNAYKPAVGYIISTERNYQEVEPSMVGTGSKQKGALVDDFLSTTHVASIEHRSVDDMMTMLPLTVFELNGKAIEEPVAITKRIAQYLERVKTESGCMKFESMVRDKKYFQTRFLFDIVSYPFPFLKLFETVPSTFDT